MVVVLPWKLVVKFVHEWILLNRFRVSLLTTQATTTYYLALYNYFISWIFFYDILCQMLELKSRAYKHLCSWRAFIIFMTVLRSISKLTLAEQKILQIPHKAMNELKMSNIDIVNVLSSCILVCYII